MATKKNLVNCPSFFDNEKIIFCACPKSDETPRVAVPASACLWIDDKAGKKRVDDFYNALLTRKIEKAPRNLENFRVWFSAFNQFRAAFDKLARARANLKERYYALFFQLSAFMIESGWSTIKETENVACQEVRWLEHQDDNGIKEGAANRARQLAGGLGGIKHKILILSSGPDAETATEDTPTKTTEPTTTEPAAPKEDENRAPGSVGPIGFNRSRFAPSCPYTGAPILSRFDPTPRGVLRRELYALSDYHKQIIERFLCELSALLTKRARLVSYSIDIIRNFYTDLYNNNIFLFKRDSGDVAPVIECCQYINPDTPQDAARREIKRLNDILRDALSQDENAPFIFAHCWIDQNATQDQPAVPAPVESAPVVESAPAPLLIARDPAPLLLTVEKDAAPVVVESAPARVPSAVEIAPWEGEETPAPAAPGYILPNIETARRSHECNHMGEFSAARYTAEYMREIDTIRAAAARQIEKVDPVFHDQIRGAVAYYEKKRAQLENDYNRAGASYAAWFIAGPSKYNIRKSDAKNSRMDDLIKEIGALYDKTISKIKTAGTVISSDNSDALRLLRDKLEKLQARQKLELEANKYWRKNGYSWKGYDGALKEETQRRELGNGYSAGFFTDNNAQEIRRIKERIVDLEKREVTNYGAPVEFGGGRVEFNTDENRLQLIFDDKPDADTRDTLKKNGFRWSPRFKAWQRQLNRNAIWIAKQLGYLPKDYRATVEPEAVEPEAFEEIDDDDETSDDDDAEETTEEKERAFELVATSTVERLGAGVVPWRHLKSDMKTAPRSWERLRPYSLNNTLIIESTPETRGARLLITLDRADVKDDDGKSVIDWTQYDDTGAEVWQPKKIRVIPIKDDAGNIIKDDDGKILVARKVSKYGKVTIHDADMFPWLEKERAAKYAQLERIVAPEIKERDAKRAALLGAAPEKWASNLAQIVKRFFDGTKLTTERAVLGQEIARAFIASRLGFDLEWTTETEKKDAARLLALCTQGDKKHGTTGHALQVVLKHVNKCVASILYQSQPTAIKPREEKPAPALTVEEKQPTDDERKAVEKLDNMIETYKKEVDSLGKKYDEQKSANAWELEADIFGRINATNAAAKKDGTIEKIHRDLFRCTQKLANTRIMHGIIERRERKREEKEQKNLLVKRPNSDGSTSYLSNGVEILRDVTNAH